MSLEPIEIARKIVDAATEKQASDIVLLDMRQACSFTDYFVILSGESDRQLDAAGDGPCQPVAARFTREAISQIGIQYLVDSIEVIQSEGPDAKSVGLNGEIGHALNKRSSLLRRERRTVQPMQWCKGLQCRAVSPSVCLPALGSARRIQPDPI